MKMDNWDIFEKLIDLWAIIVDMISFKFLVFFVLYMWFLTVIVAIVGRLIE